MAEEAKQLQAYFDIGDYEAETIEGTGFTPGETYTFFIDKEPRGKYMQYGANSQKVHAIDGKEYPLKGLYVINAKGKYGMPKERYEEYVKHPANFEIFTYGEINGQQALIPGKDFAEFKPYLTPIMEVGWKCEENGRLVFMSLGDAKGPSVNPTHPEFESVSVLLARRMNYDPPVAKINGKPNPEKFSWSFLHVGVRISAKVNMRKPYKEGGKETPEIDIETVELLDADGNKQEQQQIDNSQDQEIKDTIIELAVGCKTASQVINKARTHIKGLNLGKAEEAAMFGKYSELIGKLRDSKQILN